MPVTIGGHRGFGCTDHEFFAERGTNPELPVENSLRAIKAAFVAGADFVEIDAVQSLDGRVFLMHSVATADHVFREPRPRRPLNRLTWDEISTLKSGRAGRGEICLLSDALRAIEARDPKTADFAINIELKGNDGSGEPDAPDFLANIARDVTASGLLPDRVLFSSFALDKIIAMARLMPRARYGMLFSRSGGGGTLAFDRISIAAVKTAFAERIARQGQDIYLHPEIGSLKRGELEELGREGWKFNLWSSFEEPLDRTMATYRELIALSLKHALHLGIITDHVVAVRRLLNEELDRRSV